MAEIDGFTDIDRLKDHYKHCIRLSASNKINTKNAFDLQLIDFMQDLLTQSEDGPMNFKIASSALDVGAKIYSNRVDCIQSEAQKVASSILMALDGQQSKKDENSDPNDTQVDANNSNNSDRMNDSRENDEDGQTKATKKKRTNNKSIKTVIDDENTLDAKLETMASGDAFPDGLSQDYDVSEATALISLNSMITNPPACQMNIESNHSRIFNREISLPQPNVKQGDKLLTIMEVDEPKEGDDLDETQVMEDAEEKESTEKEDTNQDEDPMEQDQEQIGVQQVSSEKTDALCILAISNNQVSSASSNTLNEHSRYVNLFCKTLNCGRIVRKYPRINRLCLTMDNFLFDDRTTTLNSNLDTTHILNTSNNPDPISGIPNSRGCDLDPDGNGMANDYGDDHFADAESIAGDEENQPLDKDENDVIPNLDKIAASKPTDYGYSLEHSRLLDTWAGPHAWKAVKAPQSTRKNNAPQSTRKRAKLEQKPINFEEGFSTNLEEVVDKNIRHSISVIRSWRKGFIPEDHNLTGEKVRNETIVRIYNKPEDTYHCVITPADALKLVDQDHDYSKNDEREIVTSPGLGGFDDVHDDSDDEFRADPVEGNELAIYSAPLDTSIIQQADFEFAGENLIEQPYTVAHVNIPFAKIAKKMDVRKLKRVMWDLLLPPERRLGIQNNITVIENVVPNEDNGGEINSSSKNENSIMMGGDEQQNETVIMNGVETQNRSEMIDKTGPSPAPSEPAVHLEFSNLYGELPVRVSSKMASDLSQPIAFVTLLHLANEKVSFFSNLISFQTLRFFPTYMIQIRTNR